MDTMNFFTSEDDSRLCAAAGVGTAVMRSTKVTSVSVALFRRRGDIEAVAFQMLNPAEARQMALELWNYAEKADRAMNAAIEVREESN